MSASTLKTTIMLLGRVDPSVSKAMATGEKMAATSGNKIGKVFLGATAAISTAALAASAAAVKSAIGYETSLAKVSTIADTTAKSMAQISKDTLTLSNNTGLAAADVNEATYQAISAGVKTESAAKVVGVAAKAAKGGFSDVTTAVDGLTTVLNAYGLSAENTDKIANQMLITQNLGKTTFGDLAGSVGKLAPTMNAANIGTDEMFSSLAALTANGIQTSEAVSGMKAAVANIIKPTTEAAKVADKLGLDFSAAALQSKGLSGFLADVKAKTGGNLETMSKLFGSVEGLNSILTLTSDQGMSLLAKSMGEMQTNTTALEDAYNKMASTPAERIARLQNKMSNLGIQIGEKLLPIVENVMGKVESIDFDALFSSISSGMQWIIDNGPALESIAIAIGVGMATWNVVGMIQGVVGAVTAFQAANEGATIAQAVLNTVMSANPIGIVVTAVAALVAGFGFLIAKTGGVQQAFEAVWEVVKKVGDIIGGVFDKVKGVLGIGAKNGLTISTQNEDRAVRYHATGGTFTVPHLAVVGDAPETIVPHGNTPHNRSLLQEAARGVGASAGGSAVYQIYWSPEIYGNSAQEVKQGILDSEQEFESRMSAFLASKERRAFA